MGILLLVDKNTAFIFLLVIGGHHLRTGWGIALGKRIVHHIQETLPVINKPDRFLKGQLAPLICVVARQRYEPQR